GISTPVLKRVDLPRHSETTPERARYREARQTLSSKCHRTTRWRLLRLYRLVPTGGPGWRDYRHCAAWRGWLLDLRIYIFRWADNAARARELVAQISLRVVLVRFRALAHRAWRIRLRACIRVELFRLWSHGRFGCRRGLRDCRRRKQDCGRHDFTDANSADHCMLPSALNDVNRPITT